MKTIFIYSLCVIAVLSAIGKVEVPIAYATQVNYIPLAPINAPGSEFTKDTECVAPTCFPRYLRTIYNVGVALAGFFAVFAIVRGGFTLIFTDSILGHSEAKGIILRAIGGVVIVYGSFIFMNQISPSLGSDLDLSLNFDRVTVQKVDATLQVVDNPEEHYSKVLDKLLSDLKTENAKPNVIDAKIAKAKAMEAADAIWKLEENMRNPTATQAEILAFAKKKTELETLRASLLRKAVDADVVAAKARINLQAKNYEYQIDANPSIDGANRIFLEGIEEMGKKRDVEVQELNRLGFPAKAQEVQAEFITALKSLCAKYNTAVGPTRATDCTKIGQP